MAHVTMIHGIANKPPADHLRSSWLAALAADGGPDLLAGGHFVELVYWADVLYPAPLDEGEEEALSVAGTDLERGAEAPAPVVRSFTEASSMAGLAAKFGYVAA